MPRIKLVLEYDGTDYVGWQVQANGPSVQARVTASLCELVGEAVELEVAGRTDSGVHALGQVVCFTTRRALPMKAFRLGLNGLLPQDISVVDAEEVALGFDPRRWSRGKHYQYLISNRGTRAPLRRRTHWEVFAPLSVDSMREASRCLIGRYDFSAFRASDCQARHAVRNLTAVDVSGESGDSISIHVKGTAFLKHMVRNIAGSLVEVGKGRRPASWLKDVLKSKDRRGAGPTAPAHGLTLMEVQYGDGPQPRLDPDDTDDDA